MPTQNPVRKNGVFAYKEIKNRENSAHSDSPPDCHYGQRQSVGLPGKIGNANTGIPFAGTGSLLMKKRERISFTDMTALHSDDITGVTGRRKKEVRLSAYSRVVKGDVYGLPTSHSYSCG